MYYKITYKGRVTTLKKFFKIGCGGFIALIVLGAIIGALGGGDDATNKKEVESQSVSSDVIKNEETPEEKAAREAKEAEEKAIAEQKAKEDSVPREYKSALKKAESYAKTMAMSKAGIYDQLTSEYGENFPAEAAQYAIDNIVFDWKANALKKAQSYAETMSMSDSAIYDQLVSEYGEKFTAEEAQYAIDNLE